jgi:hypothetical protein
VKSPFVRWIAFGLLGLLMATPALLTPTRASAEIAPATPTPSFITSAAVAIGPAPGTPLSGPGCPATGSWSEIVMPDGTRLNHISQVNIIAPGVSPTPCPGYAVPSASPSAPPDTSVTRVEDELFTYFGAWTAYLASPQFPKSGIGDHASAITGAAYGILFTGSEVRLYGAKAPYHGIATVRIDGSVPFDVDLYAAIRVDQTLVWSSGTLVPGVHRVLVTVSGRKNAASSDFSVNADRIDLVGGAFIPPLAP